MTSDQFNRALARLQLSQVAAGRVLGMTTRTMSRCATGVTEIHPAVAKVLKLALAGKITVEDIETA
jgi:DNA-binding transcriptional regulator YdaS (Cro superfamily)